MTVRDTTYVEGPAPAPSTPSPVREYLVGTVYESTSEAGKTAVYQERFHARLEDAIADYDQRRREGARNLIICKVLPVRTVVVDYDAAGQSPHHLPSIDWGS